MKAKNHSEATKRPKRITPVQLPAHKDIGFNTSIVEQAIAAGPAGLRQAQRIALRYARRYQEEAADEWKLETQWLKSFDAVHRARARYARVWRPRFLAALSMCHSPELAARHARISCQMAYYHRKHDPQFAEQWDKAREHGVEMLHARAFQRALEGDLEPVYYMGVCVGHLRKFDSRLQIEMLRAYKPDTFKTAGVNVNIGARNNVLVLTEEMRHRLIEYNRQWLLDPTTMAKETPASHSVTPQPQHLTNSEIHEPLP
jgi:hypothetical protein